MDCSLFSPSQNLPWYLCPVWPRIFWRIQRLKAWFRRAGGPGSQMLWGVDHRGRVNILSLSDDLSGRAPLTRPVKPMPSRALRAVLAGEFPHALHMPPNRRRRGRLALYANGLAGFLPPCREDADHGLPLPDP